MIKKIFLIVSAVVFAVSGAMAKDDNFGKHIGELKQLQISVVYTNFFYRDAQGYPVYYIGAPMSCEIHIKNTGSRIFNRLTITAQHQYYESGKCDRWWYPYPRNVTYSKGEVLPGDSSKTWTGISLIQNAEITLTMTYVPPLATCDGLDQTCVSIKHTNEGGETSALFYYNPECGVFCPPPPK